MTITPCSPEVISLEDFEPTALADLFVNRSSGEAVIVQGEVAFRISTTK